MISLFRYVLSIAVTVNVLDAAELRRIARMLKDHHLPGDTDEASAGRDPECVTSTDRGLPLMRRQRLICVHDDIDGDSMQEERRPLAPGAMRSKGQRLRGKP